MHTWIAVENTDGIHKCTSCGLVRFDYRKNKHRFQFRGMFNYIYAGVPEKRIEDKYDAWEPFYTIHLKCGMFHDV